jgi:hypothetical protein
MHAVFTCVLGASCLLCGPARAQAPVIATLDPKAPGATLPADFSGLSFESEKLLPDASGARCFSPTNRALVTLFQTLGIKSLRVGGNTADRAAVKVPGPPDIDSLFAFAETAGVKVIYTLRLREGDPQQDAQIARYLLDHYRAELSCLAIGNEPNVFARQYPAYRDEWKKYLQAITAPGFAPDARFCGPSATPGKTAWARDFIRDFGSSGKIVFISQHDYPGGGGNKVTDPAAARDQMLSPDWLKKYERFYRSFAADALSHALPYRLEEANNFFNGGAKDVSDTFAAALWVLDYMHWWAAHDAAGINFHTGDKVAAGERTTGCRYATFWTCPGGYDVHPIGYGIKAFALAGGGRILPVKLKRDAAGLNLTAYGILAPDKAVCVTLINKEHGPGARAARVTLAPGPGYTGGQVMFLTAPGGEVAAKTGVTLGGAPIRQDGTWEGAWTRLAVSSAGPFRVQVPAASAAIVRLSGG